MKPYQLIILIFFCLFLTGCSHTGSGSGPSGRLPINQETSSNCALITDGRRRKQCEQQRTDAGNGRNVPPKDNSACTQSTSGGKCCDYPHWLTTAERFIGLHEGGDGTFSTGKNKKWRPDYKNKTIAGFTYMSDGQSVDVDRFHNNAEYKRGKIKTFDDLGAWCGSFAWWCFNKTINPKTGKPYDGKPYKPKSEYNLTFDFEAIKAETWKLYGQNLGKEPCFGALMILKLGDGYHVSFLVGVKIGKNGERTYLGLGGNQGDMVKISNFKGNTLKAFVLPSNYNPCDEHSKIDYLINTPYISKAVQNGGGANVNSR